SGLEFSSESEEELKRPQLFPYNHNEQKLADLIPSANREKICTMMSQLLQGIENIREDIEAIFSCIATLPRHERESTIDSYLQTVRETIRIDRCKMLRAIYEIPPNEREDVIQKVFDLERRMRRFGASNQHHTCLEHMSAVPQNEREELI